MILKLWRSGSYWYQTETKAAQELTRYFNGRGDEIWKAWDLGQAETLLNELEFQFMLVDINFPANEWIGFLQRAQHKYPQCKIVITHKFPDLHREMLAREPTGVCRVYPPAV